MVKVIIEINDAAHCQEIIDLMEKKLSITKAVIASYIKELNTEFDGLMEMKRQLKDLKENENGYQSSNT